MTRNTKLDCLINTGDEFEENKKKRVLVTGGAGYLGSVLCRHFLEKRYHVRCFDMADPRIGSMAAVRDHPHFEQVTGSILELDKHPALFEEVDAVVHLAGLTSDERCHTEPKQTDLVNYWATFELAERCLEVNIRRFVFASSCSVYGRGLMLDEGSPLAPVSLYARSKIRAERKLLGMTERGFEPVLLRQATLFGWSPIMRFDLAVNAMTLNATVGRRVEVLGGGDQWRPFLHVSDSAEAFECAVSAQAEAVAGEVFNVGCNEQNFTIRKLGKMVAETVPEAILVEEASREIDPRSYNITFDKIHKKLEWRPCRTVRDGIEEVHHALRNSPPTSDAHSRFYGSVYSKKEETPAAEGGQPLRAHFLPFALPQIGKEEEHEVLKVLRSGWLSTGERTTRFEDMLRAYTGAAEVVALNSCTAALHLSLVALGVKRGDEVITTPVTWPATANVIEHVGATPVFVDVERDTLNIDPAVIEEKITERTRAIIPVHMAGQPVKLDRIQEIAERRGLVVVEDAAHALGAKYRGHPIGSISRFTCFSFYPTKSITTGEGGAIALTRPEDTEKVRMLSRQGMSKDAWKRRSEQGFTQPECVAAGYKYNMPDLCAALGIHQLRRLDEFIDKRRHLTQIYRQELASVTELILPPTIGEIRHAYHLFIVMLRSEMLRINRDQLMLALKRAKIGTGIHFRGLHLHPFYREKYSLQAEELPQATFISDRIISLPLYPSMTPDDVRTVADTLKRIVIFYRNGDTLFRPRSESFKVAHQSV